MAPDTAPNGDQDRMTTTAATWDGRPMFALDADVTVYWPDVRPCYEEQAASPETPECRPCPPSGVTLGT